MAVKPIHSRRRGSALLAVLWLSAALAAIAFAMSTTVRGETDRAITAIDELRTYYLASSGAERATMEFLWTATQGKTLIPRGENYVDYAFPSGVAHVEILPEAGKLDINKATEEDLAKLTLALGVDPGRASAIASGIVAWRSPGGRPNSGGAPSFQVPQTSFEEIEEILQVRGVTPDLFYGSWIPSANGDASRSALIHRPGLNDCLTVYGSPLGVDSFSAAPALLRALGKTKTSGLQMDAISQLQVGTNSVVTFRSTARLKMPDGKLSDMTRTVAVQVKFDVRNVATPYHVLRWYDTAWSY